MSRVVKSMTRQNPRPMRNALLAAAGLILVAGCSSSATDTASSGGPSPLITGNYGSTRSAGIATFTPLADCPKVRVIDGTQTLRVYAKGKDKDPFSLRYQVSITKTARDCSESGGQLYLKVGVSGRLIPGPMWTPETVRVPVRIALVGPEEKVLVSNLHIVEMTATDPNSSPTWAKVDSNIVAPSGEAVEALVGFDYEEAKKKRRR